MEEGEELTLGEDQAAPLVTEVSSYFSFMIYSLDHFIFLSSILFNLSFPFQVLQKICLANLIRHMADLLHVDTVQHLEEALLGSPVTQVADLLSGDWDRLSLSQSQHLLSAILGPILLPPHLLPL